MAKKKVALVSQYLENISRSALEKYQDIIKSYVRHRQGIYALYRRDRLYYVGLASDLRWRVGQHLKDHHGQSWDRFSVYFTIGDEHLRDLESLVLRIVKPSGNKIKGSFGRTENLRRQFAHDMRQRFRDELDELIGKVRPQDSRVAKNGNKRLNAIFAKGKQIKTIKATYKHKNYTARLHADGSIRQNGKVYKSPSAAAVAVVKRACNGWSFWKIERAPGDWVRLKHAK